MAPTQAGSEDNLIFACQKGDEAAAASLVDALWDRVYAFAYRLSGNPSDAEDVTQETFLRAFKKIQSYKPDGRFKAWLFRIATNIFLDQKKSLRQKSEVASDVVQADERATDPEDHESRKELVRALYEAMDDLSKEQKVVVMLRAMEHMDYPEIAGILNAKESTARWHMYEARRILRRKLSKRFDLEGLADE
jgi:RNA polymerase sigma-70 factor, ECF subfamily